MNKHMITINSADIADKAITWCDVHINSVNWTTDLVAISPRPKYVFKFKNKSDAAFFALKWA